MTKKAEAFHDFGRAAMLDLYLKAVPQVNKLNSLYMEASEPKWVNPVLNIIRVNSLRLGGLHIICTTTITTGILQ